MLTLNAATLPSEHREAHTLLEIIANPDLARQHLDALRTESLAASQASENAHKLVIEAKEKDAAADAKLADAMKVISEHDRDHAARVKQLEERHALITATDARLTAYEKTVAEREQELTGRIASHDHAASEREAALNEREAALSSLETAGRDVKETYEQKLAALKQAMGG